MKRFFKIVQQIIKRFFKITKKILFFLFVVFCSLCVAAFFILLFEGELSPKNFPTYILSTFDCDYERTHHFDNSGRDTFMFFCYELSEPQIDTELFAPVTDDALSSITKCINVFEDGVGHHKNCTDDKGSCEVITNYCFDRDTLDADDYYYFNGEHSAYNFKLYIFDTKTNALYYFFLTF